MLLIVNTVSYRAIALRGFPSRCQGLSGGYRSASSEGGRSLRRSTCDAPASLRLTSLPESSARTPLPRLLRRRPEAPGSGRPVRGIPRCRPVAPGTTHGYVSVFMKRSTKGAGWSFRPPRFGRHRLYGGIFPVPDGP